MPADIQPVAPMIDGAGNTSWNIELFQNDGLETGASGQLESGCQTRRTAADNDCNFFLLYETFHPVHLSDYPNSALGRIPERRFFTWIYTLALNLIRNHLKRRHIPVVDAPPLAGGLETGSDPAAALESEPEKKRLQGLLPKLSAEQREALLMRFFTGLFFEEMAEVLGISQSGAKMRVSRALVRLRVLARQ
jgi:RNA polymerase sigma factor (sigma-70 family)